MPRRIEPGLWPAGTKRFGESAPLGIFAKVQVFNETTDIAWPVRVKTAIGNGRTSVLASFVASQDTKSDKRIEEVTGAALGHSDAPTQIGTVEWPLREGGDDTEFHRTH
jgi:hypothetical protein